MAIRLRLTPDRLRGRAVLRDPAEDARAASPLELLFDLTFVVAVSRASAALHHELLAGHIAQGVVGFAAVFFAVWWAWMNFTWFMSAHDADDVPQRMLTLVQMTGVLVLAAGVTRAVEDQDFSVAVAGYVIMRLGLVVAWLRVARDVPVPQPGQKRQLVRVVGRGEKIRRLPRHGRLRGLFGRLVGTFNHCSASSPSRARNPPARRATPPRGAPGCDR